MQIKSLDHCELAEIVKCFNGAFADYFVKMPTEVAYWEHRWKAARVDYRLSFGMFDSNELVGFIINGIDEKDMLLTAFNSGTGVLPKYRGKKIVKQIYDVAIPILLENGVECCGLEVIVENEKAIKAYQSAGFEIAKTFKCYSGELKVGDFENVSTQKNQFEKIEWNKLPNQEFYSWDFQKNGIEILKDRYKFFEAFENSNKIGHFIINPKNGTVAQFDLTKENSKADWLKLFSSIKNIAPKVKINNIDDRLQSKIKAVENVGLANTIDQYEMELLLKSPK